MFHVSVSVTLLSLQNHYGRRYPLNSASFYGLNGAPSHAGGNMSSKRSRPMAETCCSRSAAGSQVCELPSPTVHRASRSLTTCPICGEKGKPVEGQTVKALLSVTLRDVQNTQYLFCRTQTCPVVYFSLDGGQVLRVEQVRERVYQKDPTADDVFICYCFRHTFGEIRAASGARRLAILEDITVGIEADQCACDLRNPQGSCCLGNVRRVLQELERGVSSAPTTSS